MADKSPIARRPIAQHGLANDVLHGQAAPGVRITRVIAVVSQNKDVTWLDDRGWMRVVRPLKDIRLIEHMPINQHLAAHNLQMITRQTNHAFDQVPLRIVGVMKDDDGPALHLAQATGHLIDQQELLLVEVGLHAAPFDAKVLHERSNDGESHEGAQ